MFDRLYGNRRFKECLAELSEKDKLPHSVIIEGEKGLGRKIAAGYLAAAAVCSFERKRPCLTCDDCRLALELRHPDVRLFTPEKKLFTVELARSVRSYAYIKPMTARKSVLILEQCESMNNEAQNALLKVLEEPPETALFILITENAASLLPTVLSRCTLFSLQQVSDSELCSFLVKEKGCTEEEAYRLASVAEGNIGKAIAALDGGSLLELKTVADSILTAYKANNRTELLRLAYTAEKSSSPETVVRLLYESLFSELKAASGAHDTEAEAAYLSACETAAAASAALAANQSKPLVLNLMCGRLGQKQKL